MTTTYTHFAKNLTYSADKATATGAEKWEKTHFEGATHGWDPTIEQWVLLTPKDGGGFPVGKVGGFPQAKAEFPEVLGPYQVLKPWQASTGDFGKGWRLRDPVNGIVLSAGQARQALKFGGVIDMALTAAEIAVLDRMVAANAPRTEAIRGRRRR